MGWFLFCEKELEPRLAKERNFLLNTGTSTMVAMV